MSEDPAQVDEPGEDAARVDVPGEEPGGQARPSARDLVRRRSRSYRTPETGRHHHIGAAPERQPVLGDDGSASYVGTSPVQLAARTPAQLQAQAERLRAAMAAAAEGLRFEEAGALRDDLERVEAERRRRRA